MDITGELDTMGFNLHASFEIERLPPPLHEELTRREPKSTAFRYLLLVSDGGSSLWRNMMQQRGSEPQERDPVDTFTRRCLQSLLGNDAAIIYPGNHFIPLQGLGSLAGWHHTSPLGLGIHPEFGLWYAYRAVILSNEALTPLTDAPGGESPCADCDDRPCIAACPASAALESGFNVRACSSFRLPGDSPCESTCLARQACPVDAEHRYGVDQMTYHCQASVAAIRRFSR